MFSSKWLYDDGSWRTSTGILIDPTHTSYFAYKIFPLYTKQETQVKISICYGRLRRLFYKGDRFILLSEKEEQDFVFKESDKALEYIADQIMSKIHHGWYLKMPAFSTMFLQSSWKSLHKIRLRSSND